MWVETLGQGKGIVGYQNKFGIPDLLMSRISTKSASAQGCQWSQVMTPKGYGEGLFKFFVLITNSII